MFTCVCVCVCGGGGGGGGSESKTYYSSVAVFNDIEIESPAGQISSTCVTLPRWLTAAATTVKDAHRCCTQVAYVRVQPLTSYTPHCVSLEEVCTQRK